jgi:Flp pilus assembly protein CpaB
LEDRSRRRARLVLIVGFLFALIAAAGSFFYTSSAKTDTPVAIPTSDVVVAAREIPQRTAISASDLRVVKMNTDVVPPAAVRDSKEVVGKVTVQTISVGEPILPSKLAGSAAQPFTVFPAEMIGANGLPNPGTPAYRAMSITVADAEAAGGAIQPGDIVDLLYALNFDPTKYFLTPIPPKNGPDISAHIIVERIPILTRNGAVYTIRVDAALAERIAYIQQAGGTIKFLLRAPKDDRASGATGATFKTVYPEFKFPVPEKIAIP